MYSGISRLSGRLPGDDLRLEQRDCGESTSSWSNALGSLPVFDCKSPHLIESENIHCASCILGLRKRKKTSAGLKLRSQFSEQRAVAGKASQASCAGICENELWLYSDKRRG